MSSYIYILFPVRAGLPSKSFIRPIGPGGGRLRVGILVRDMDARTESNIAVGFAGGLDRKKFCPILITPTKFGANPFSNFMKAHCEQVVVVGRTGFRGQVSPIRSLDLDILIICNKVAAQASNYQMLPCHDWGDPSRFISRDLGAKHDIRKREE